MGNDLQEGGRFAPTQIVNTSFEVNMNGIIEVTRHRLLLGDITTGVVGVLMGDDRADVVYSDPPWGPGNQQYWHTYRDRGSVPRTDWPGFLNAFCRAVVGARKLNAPVFVEMGMRWTGDLDGAMGDVGLPKQRDWAITYGPKNKQLPLRLTLYGPEDHPIDLGENTYGEAVTREVLRSVVHPGTIVLDPCTGLGMTSRWTHRFGGCFRGTEMTAKRLAVTEAWLRKAVR